MFKFILFGCLWSFSVIAQTDIIKINLSSQDKDYLNDIYQYKNIAGGKAKIKVTKKRSYKFNAPRIQFNDQELQEVELSTRGNQCLRAPRRCFSVKFSNKVKIGNKKLNQFNLVSMWQDEGYITANIGYKIYKSFGLFHLSHKYVEIQIDGKTNGLYLLIEKPNQVLKQKFNSPFIGRTGYFTKLEIKKYYKNETNFKKKDFKKTFKEIIKKSIKLPEEDLYNYLSERMNIENYFKMLALNTFMQNGDYVDEIYFFARDEDTFGRIYFDIMVWDLDDLFNPPHWGPWNNLIFKKKLKNSFMYSMESKLDRILDSNPYTKDLFENSLYTLLSNSLSDDFIDKTIDEVKKEITPYLTKNILATSIKDDHRNVSYSRDYIFGLLEKRRSQMKLRRRELLKALSQI